MELKRDRRRHRMILRGRSVQAFPIQDRGPFHSQDRENLSRLHGLLLVHLPSSRMRSAKSIHCSAHGRDLAWKIPSQEVR